MHVLRAFTLAAAAVSTVGAIAVACSDNNSTGIPAGLEVYTADLNGANERPTAVTSTAKAHAIITVLGTQISWQVEITSAIDSVIAGHIHRGIADSAGGVVQSLSPTATGLAFTGIVANGSATPPDSVIALMRAGKAYVNIHTKAHTAGEIRGQLVKQ
ncbi:MAG TPA: CHRD domain-containing protein [Gemmatimonadales bacterium]|nr:CHRD domain-containing protein [Gemmatimonadales bacterium]